jgi:hypothetical protein
LTEIEGKAAYIWILGEFGDQIEDSPYILERMVDEMKEFNSQKISLAVSSLTPNLIDSHSTLQIVLQKSTRSEENLIELF